MTRRLLAVIVAVVAAAGSVLFVVSSRGSAGPTGPVLHRIDLVAAVDYVTADPGWSFEGPVTVGTARLTLDDLRTLTLAPGTNVADHDIAPRCTDLTSRRACVLLADMLGEAVVWFALVPAHGRNPETELELPGIVDMRENGDVGVFRNGWVIPLASPTKRVCEGTDTAHLRDFITRFPGDRARSIVDLRTDRIVRVECSG